MWRGLIGRRRALASAPMGKPIPQPFVARVVPPNGDKVENTGRASLPECF